MSQLTQALEVVKDLSRMKARLMKSRAELSSILERSQENQFNGKSDGSIEEDVWNRFRSIRDGIDILLERLKG